MKDRSWLRPPRNSVTMGPVPSWRTGRRGTRPQRLHSDDSGTAPALHQPGGARDPRVPFTGVRRHTCMWGESLTQDEDPYVCDPDTQAVCGASRGCNCGRPSVEQPVSVSTETQVQTVPPRDVCPVSAKTHPTSLQSWEHMSLLLGHICLKPSGRKTLSISKELTQTLRSLIFYSFSDVLRTPSSSSSGHALKSGVT